MTTPNSSPIACTLPPRDYHKRLIWIAQLARDALRAYERRGLELELRFAPEAAEKVRDMVRKERVCCAFLTFDLRESPQQLMLTIRAPEGARGALDTIFA